MTEVRNRVSGLASPGDSAADKQRRLGDLLDRQGRAQSHLTHLEKVRDRLQEKYTQQRLLWTRKLSLLTWPIRFGRPSSLPTLFLGLIMVVQSLRWTLILGYA